ncbi:hypothetical protein NDU88_001969 [Pleurodeles waltl]|uniref:Uncharacterized protein n=1 Tax=Pleurodeles waltl TaxID=8319 RepID=A0AAV7QBM2_PLEWA|nr:hypothetical protein NDU88_001969 [Pleurodeles waltl]
MVTLMSGKKGAGLGNCVFAVASQGGARREQTERWEEEKTLRRLQGVTGAKEDGGNCPLPCDPEQETTEGKQPKANDSGGCLPWSCSFPPCFKRSVLRQVCGQV